MEPRIVRIVSDDFVTLAVWVGASHGNSLDAPEPIHVSSTMAKNAGTSGRMGRRIALIGVLVSAIFPGLSAAEESKPGREEIVNRLKASYAKLEGYVAIYQFKVPSKTAEITLAMDAGSGLSVLHLVGSKDGRRNETRLWSTREGRVYLDDGNSLKRMDAYMAGYQLFTEMNRLVEGPDENDGVSLFATLVPSVIVKESSLDLGLNMGKRNEPSWTKWIKGAPLKEADGRKATFSTAGHGDVSISLESGLVVHQSTEGEDGGVSLMEMKEVRLNPGAGPVAELTARWKTDGAETMDGAMAALGRQMMFQLMIDGIEKGDLKLADLREHLLDKRETMETFADGCVVEKKGSLAESGKWEKVANDASLRNAWTKVVPGGKKEDDLAFSAYLADAGNRRKLREQIVEELTAGENLDILWSNLTMEIFGKGDAGDAKLKTTNDDGVAAKKAIQKSLGRAYFSVIMDREITKYSNAREREAK
jgi:hypothetical protein